jgi:signal transduction histidine kinase
MSQEEAEIIEGLKKELEETREYFATTVEEYETSNEELWSFNKKLQLMNEELQSTTKKLKSSQEKLQKVNKELEEKVEKLNRANSDLKNLMDATEMAILFVNCDLLVERFTASAKNIFNLEPSDKGRPLEQVTHRLKYSSIKDDMEYVLDTQEEIKKIVGGRDGRTYMMRLRPYRSLKDTIEGVVLTFAEITQLKEAEEKLQQQKLQETLVAMGTFALEKNDYEEIMHRALQQVCMGLEVEYSVLFTYDPGKNILQLFDATGSNLDKEKKIKVEADPKWGICYALKEESPLVITNYSEEERFSLSPLFDHLDIQSGVNIKVMESDEVCGILGVYSEKKRAFSEDEVSFVQIASNIMGMTSERIKKNRSLKEMNKQLEEEVRRSREYQREILQNSIAERWNLGGYLHDNLAQTLVSIKVMISGIKAETENADLDLSSQIDMILENIDEGITQIRNLTHEIIPVDIEEEGVEHAFRLLVRELQKTHDVNCILKVDEVIEKINDKEVATNLYHIIQEAVKNAAIHGEAEKVIIETAEVDDKLKLEITDDGLGISNTDYKKDEGCGTNIMRHRIELLGGSFSRKEIADGEKTGTRVICTLPLTRLDQAERKA